MNGMLIPAWIVAACVVVLTWLEFDDSSHWVTTPDGALFHYDLHNGVACFYKLHGRKCWTISDVE